MDAYRRIAIRRNGKATKRRAAAGSQVKAGIQEFTKLIVGPKGLLDYRTLRLNDGVAFIGKTQKFAKFIATKRKYPHKDDGKRGPHKAPKVITCCK